MHTHLLHVKHVSNVGVGIQICPNQTVLGAAGHYYTDAKIGHYTNLYQLACVYIYKFSLPSLACIASPYVPCLSCLLLHLCFLARRIITGCVEYQPMTLCLTMTPCASDKMKASLQGFCSELLLSCVCTHLQQLLQDYWYTLLNSSLLA